ncbi:hypothetical protein ACX9NE_14390 [Mycobacterium sp. ML4]
MNTFDLATWLAIAGAVFAALGVFTASLTYRSARSLRKKVPDSEFETAIHVVIVVPDEERRYFLSVPPGLGSWEVVDRVAKALADAETEKVDIEMKRPSAQSDGPS